MHFLLGDVSKLFSFTALCVLVALAPRAVFAESKFSLGPFLGMHRPVVEDLNEGEFKSPISGMATIVNFQDDTQTQERIYIQNPLPALGIGANAGLELQWAYNAKYSVIVGGSSWEASSSASVQGPFAIQGVRSDVITVRTATLSYNEFYVGLRR
ncbi:MAG TPA: hypothetical protein ENK35_08900, partial [Candidatus Tenderia sp.]|nr:hypothetical protein [Candidatus Tenderia sp.]